jgi:hypothetical protein
VATIAAIRAGIKASLVGISGVTWYDLHPGQVILPAGVVRRQLTSYGVDFDGSDDHTFAVSLYMPLTEVSSAQTNLDELLSTSGTRSVKAALEVDGTFGGVVQFANVERVAEEGVAELSGVQCLVGTVVISVGAM